MRAHQRERMIAATAELVAERGYQATTLEAIAKSAKVALTTFYDHFSTKENCFLAAFDEGVEAAEERLRDAVDPQAPWPEQMTAGLRAFVDLVIEQPALARLCLVEAPGAGRNGMARYHESLERLAPKLNEGRALSNDPDSLPRGLEDSIIGGLAWLVQQRLVGGEAAKLEELIPDMQELVLAPYLNPRAGSEAKRVVEAGQEALA